MIGKSAAILPGDVSGRFCCVKNALTVVQVILAVFTALGVLLQTPKATGLGGTIGGGGDMGGGYRRRRGLERTMLRGTAVSVGLFAIVSILATYASTR
ncbi:MAG: preprotein translocase subunit SecG [Chloroflexi bacterium]|nr:MAG: preprotein translocase subunit SecG [Chloroflexota bacterium]